MKFLFRERTQRLRHSSLKILVWIEPARQWIQDQFYACKTFFEKRRWALWLVAALIGILYVLIFSIGANYPIIGWLLSVLTALITCTFIYFIRELLVVIGWMWVAVSVTVVAAALLFFSEQGLDLGVGLLGYENPLKYFLLGAVVFYWAAATWHAARRSLDRRFPTYPAVRPEQEIFVPWLRWPPRLLGICAHLFAAINLSLAVRGYLGSLAEPPHFTPTGMWSLIEPTVRIVSSKVLDVTGLRSLVAVFITWTPVLIVGLTILLFWLSEPKETGPTPAHPLWAPRANPARSKHHEDLWTVGAMGLVLVIFVMGSQSRDMPSGFFLGTAAVLLSAICFMYYVTRIRFYFRQIPPGCEYSYEDELNHDFYKIGETIACLLTALVGLAFSLVAVAIHPIWYAQNVGSMVTAFFAFGAIISVINAFDLPLDIFVWKARENPKLREVWEEEGRRPKRAKSRNDVALTGDTKAAEGDFATPANNVAATNEPNAAADAVPRDDAAFTGKVGAAPKPMEDRAREAKHAFAMKYTTVYNGLRDARIAFRLQRATFPAILGLAILVAFGASRTHFFDRIRLCEDGYCGEAQPGISGRRADIEQATLAWYDQAKFAWDNDPTHHPGSPVPLLIVATAGGGIRAAYWTATVLETLREKLAKGDEKERLHHYLFAISSVSGGSSRRGGLFRDATLAIVKRERAHRGLRQPDEIPRSGLSRASPRKHALPRYFLQCDSLPSGAGPWRCARKGFRGGQRQQACPPVPELFSGCRGLPLCRRTERRRHHKQATRLGG